MDQSHYTFHRIPKRSGGVRIIAEPEPELKHKQKRIMRWLQARGLGGGFHSHGFELGRSTATNARKHVGRKVVLKVDLKDFFGSTKAAMVRNALLAARLDQATADEIVEVCTLDGSLPAGAPTSPLLANVAAREMDRRLAGLAKKYEATYTRYADDLTFSSDKPELNHIQPALEYVVTQCGHTLNRKKTHVMRKGGRQLVTGVVVNDVASVPRELRRNARAGLHNLGRSLLDGKPFDAAAFERLKGFAAYVNAVSVEAGARLRSSVREIERLLSMRGRMIPVPMRDLAEAA